VAKTIVGSFDSFDEARRVMRELQQGGFNASDISIIANNATGEYRADETAVAATEAGTGAATGAAAGGLLGGAAGLIVGLMGLAIPGIGPIVAAGPLAATLAGAGVGAVAGGLIGGLTGAGVPEEEAQVYAEAVRRGGALVTVRAEDARADEAAAIMRSCGAIDIERRAELWREQGWSRHDPNAAPYTAEQLQRERSLYAGSLGATAGENVGARSAYTPTTSAATGRAGEWDEQGDYFRMQHREDYPTDSFDEFEPAYRYGWGLSRNERYRGRSWADIETDARRDWEQRYPNSWERFKSAVRRGWERTTEAVERAIPGDSDRDGR
jgi:Heat induced stress protein YflT domain